MNDQDKAFARLALEKKQLTIEQVEQIKAEVQRTGRPFRDIAQGLLPAPKPAPVKAAPEKPLPIPPAFIAMLVASFVIFAVLLIMTTKHLQERSHKDEELAIESSRSQIETEKLKAEAIKGYQRSTVATHEAGAREALKKARDAMGRVDAAPDKKSPDVAQSLNEAFVGYNAYLQELPDDADVRIERARTHELRRNYDLAIADLERAAQLKPAVAKACQDKVTQLRLFVARDRK